jgi:energy-converting hydrogenase Eha subunit A
MPVIHTDRPAASSYFCSWFNSTPLIVSGIFTLSAHMVTNSSVCLSRESNTRGLLALTVFRFYHPSQIAGFQEVLPVFFRKFDPEIRPFQVQLFT